MGMNLNRALVGGLGDIHGGYVWTRRRNALFLGYAGWSFWGVRSRMRPVDNAFVVSLVVGWGLGVAEVKFSTTENFFDSYWTETCSFLNTAILVIPPQLKFPSSWVLTLYRQCDGSLLRYLLVFLLKSLHDSLFAPYWSSTTSLFNQSCQGSIHCPRIHPASFHSSPRKQGVANNSLSSSFPLVRIPFYVSRRWGSTSLVVKV